MIQDQRGILFPERLPEFHRLAPSRELVDLVRWFWIPEWNLPPGVESRQKILPFPACNIVVTPEGIIAAGPATRSAQRTLTGRGWAVGALLRPAAVPHLIADPAALRDSERPVLDEALHRDVSAVMADRLSSGSARRETAAAILARWISERAPVPEPVSEGALANDLANVLADPEITRADLLPERLHASARTLQRLAERMFGLSLHSMIRRRRLQEGAARLREDPALSIAALASELGYADHAHFATDFKTVLGLTPSSYREQANEPAT